MSTEIERDGQESTRRYRKRRRAEQEDETRRRITEATVELHGSVGPARTTISAIAELAGVQRATVYRHFPDERALFNACSSHWLAQNPPPDFSAWSEIEDPERRLRDGLAQLYEWYGRTAYMHERTSRDVETVPALRPSMEAMSAMFELAAERLMEGRILRGGHRRDTRAAIGHALAFSTWHSLVVEQGLPATAAIELLAGMIATAA